MTFPKGHQTFTMDISRDQGKGLFALVSAEAALTTQQEPRAAALINAQEG